MDLSERKLRIIEAVDAWATVIQSNVTQLERSSARDAFLAELDAALTDHPRGAVSDVADELENFARYSESVAVDAAGPARLTWQELAAWASSAAKRLRGAV